MPAVLNNTTCSSKAEVHDRLEDNGFAQALYVFSCAVDLEKLVPPIRVFTTGTVTKLMKVWYLTHEG